MKLIQNSTAKIKANPISSVLGGLAGFYVTRKYVSTKWWALGLGAAVGLVGGAMVGSTIAAKSSTPKPADVK
jgi:hypothetical protein